MNSDPSTHDTSVPADESPENSGRDGFFGFVVGLYAAALVTPAVLVGVALWATTEPGVMFFVLLGTAVVVAGAVGRVARRESLAVRLGATRWVWAAIVVPLAYVSLPLVADLAGNTLPDPVGSVAILAAMFGLVGGIGLVAASHNRHAKAVLRDAPAAVEFEARAPERDRARAKRAAGGLFVAGTLGFVAGIHLDLDPLRWLFQILVPTAAGLYGATNEREVRVSEVGLVTGSPVHKRLRPWSAYESYDVTETAIVVRRAGWSPWGVRDVRRDPDDVDDPEAVAAALDRFLPLRE
ncbi:hypothetical protein [Halorussus sp. MSC15.2]|uniref:hypothetical protein n=1 Tax=Halorussus sp. MSC15.2 TaxID=2283638 RepID=UPI0013D010F8|nr:hypothetical protein [Halorussus sp. MSC15.2]NEU57430.1 hypothetical protein [Halorussus sp. MSC15.2]